VEKELLFLTEKYYNVVQSVDALVVPINFEGEILGSDLFVDELTKIIPDFDLKQVKSMVKYQFASSQGAATVAEKGLAKTNILNICLKRDLIFVYESTCIPLVNVVNAALSVANNQGYESICFPILRLDKICRNVMVETSTLEIFESMKNAIDEFEKKHPDANMKIYLLIWDNKNHNLTDIKSVYSRIFNTKK
jgi:hypothetical protein